MIPKKQMNHLKSIILQASKWTALSFACLITLSLGIFLGKKFSDMSSQPINRASVELGSKTQAIQPESKKLQDTHSEKKAVEKAHSKKSVTSTTNPPQREPSSDPEESQDNQNSKENDLNSSKTPKTESPFYNNNLPSRVAETLSAKYTIQLGIYKQEKQAISYLEHLKDQGLDAFYMSFTNDNDQAWYRVSLGVYTDKTLANNELHRILKTTSIENATIKEIL